ncbi:MAG: ABC transporter substrate-binding protein [Reyranellaceae bacterium]
MISRRTLWQGAAAALVALPLALGAGSALAQGKTLKAVMHSDLKILDPIWTTAYIVRNHGYMIYDTLFAVDDKWAVQPQMVDKYDVSADKLTYTFTLRDGLMWHDGQPVTSDDCIASIKRWGSRDSMGQKLMSFVKDLEKVNDKTFKLVLKEPYGLVIDSLGKPSSNVPFMMPKRVADTPGTEQIKEFVGSGPFIFKQDEWKPGEKVVYVKNDKYKPRAEKASGLAGGKVVNFDRVEWLAISDPQTQVNALVKGEIDLIESPAADLIPLLETEKSVKFFNWNALGNQYTMRLNWKQKPFDNEKVRQAVTIALNQEDFLKAVHGDKKYFEVYKSFYPKGTPLATTKGMEKVLESNFNESKKLLQEAGYDGTPIVLLHSTDLEVLTNLAPVARDLLTRGGFKVDMQSMDWQTVVARRAKPDPVSAGGWHAMLTSWVSADILNPVMIGFMNASCDKAPFGWPCSETIEKLRDQFSKETDPAKQKAIAEQVQLEAIKAVTHVPLGQWYRSGAHKDTVSGWLAAPAPVFWSMTKK